jgi:hypothetical protein
MSWFGVLASRFLPVAVVSMRLIRDQLFGLEATDSLTFSSATLAIIVVAALAAYLPAPALATLNAENINSPATGETLWKRSGLKDLTMKNVGVY